MNPDTAMKCVTPLLTNEIADGFRTSSKLHTVGIRATAATVSPYEVCSVSPNEVCSVSPYEVCSVR